VFNDVHLMPTDEPSSLGRRDCMDAPVRGKERLNDHRTRRVRNTAVAVTLGCVGAAVVLGDHGYQVVGGLLMAVALVAVLAAELAAAAGER
jgi:hypothetical protein